MGTRGIIAFANGDETKATYNHWDSYPSGLGLDVLRFLRERKDDPKFTEQVEQLQVVKEGRKPTAKEIKHLAPYTDLGVSEQSTDDWYCLLRKTQGDIALTLEAGYIEDSISFAADSLFCEWGYVIDTKAKQLEVYKGFNTTPHTGERFSATSPASRYQPIKLVATFPFDELPTDEQMKALEASDDDE